MGFVPKVALEFPIVQMKPLDEVLLTSSASPSRTDNCSERFTLLMPIASHLPRSVFLRTLRLMKSFLDVADPESFEDMRNSLSRA